MSELAGPPLFQGRQRPLIARKAWPSGWRRVHRLPRVPTTLAATPLSFLRLKPELDQAADSLGKTRFVALFCCPPFDRISKFIGEHVRGAHSSKVDV
jgi:hypothetical protein